MRSQAGESSMSNGWITPRSKPNGSSSRRPFLRRGQQTQGQLRLQHRQRVGVEREQGCSGRRRVRRGFLLQERAQGPDGRDGHRRNSLSSGKLGRKTGRIADHRARFSCQIGLWFLVSSANGQNENCLLKTPQLLGKPLFGFPQRAVIASFSRKGACDAQKTAAAVIGGSERGRGGTALKNLLPVAQADLLLLIDGQTGHSQTGIRRHQQVGQLSAGGGLFDGRQG